jgi:hypothetical protein
MRKVVTGCKSRWLELCENGVRGRRSWLNNKRLRELLPQESLIGNLVDFNISLDETSQLGIIIGHHYES